MRVASPPLTTTSIATRFLVALLDEARHPPDDLLREAGVDRQALASPEFALPLAPFRELWARAAAIRPDIGLRLLERFPPGQMHVLAHLALRSATVRAAIDDVCRFSSVTSAADRVGFEQAGAIARVSYASLGPAPPNPWMAEHYLSLIVVFLARVTGRSLPLVSVEFEGAAQAAIEHYEQRFGVRPRFGSTRNAISFDADALDWTLSTGDDYLHAILERVALAQGVVAPLPSVVAAARAATARMLVQGATPSMTDVAQACGLTVRVLRERLAGEQASFRRLLDEVRRDLAREHLARGLSVNETCYLLGFSEPAAFQHACRRWFGHAAGELRRSG
jgi:AraC-like DNA-binding protein